MQARTQRQKGQALVEYLILAALGGLLAMAALTALRLGIARVWVKLCAWAIWPTL